MSRPQWKSNRRKKRPWSHVIAEMGVNFLERQVLRRGHQFDRSGQAEYGTDAVMTPFSDNRRIENGQIQFQVKAKETLDAAEKGKSIPVRIEIAHINHWCFEFYPFILVVYDANRHRAFWLDVQQYVEANRLPVEEQETTTVRIPRNNKLTVRSIDHFRDLNRLRIRELP